MLRSGSLAEAERICLEAFRVKFELLEELPLAEIWTMRAYLLAKCGWVDDAYSLMTRALGLYPQDEVAQALLLHIETELLIGRDLGDAPPESEGLETNGNLIIGVGSGRCGSTTLATLLDRQNNARVSHEHSPILYWNGASSADNYHIERFRRLSARYDLVGDVAHWWLPRLEMMIRRFPSVRVIALKRDRQATVRSFLAIKGGNGRGAINHWVKHDGDYWKPNIWDPCYPKYQSDSLEVAIGEYWDEYYRRVDSLKENYPNNIRLFETEALSDPGTQSAILTFAGVAEDDQHIIPGIVRNRGSIADGAKNH